MQLFQTSESSNLLDDWTIESIHLSVILVSLRNVSRNRGTQGCRLTSHIIHGSDKPCYDQELHTLLFQGFRSTTTFTTG